MCSIGQSQALATSVPPQTMPTAGKAGIAERSGGNNVQKQNAMTSGGTISGTTRGHKNGATFGSERSCSDLSAAYPDAGISIKAAKIAGAGIAPFAPATIMRIARKIQSSTKLGGGIKLRQAISRCVAAGEVSEGRERNEPQKKDDESNRDAGAKKTTGRRPRCGRLLHLDPLSFLMRAANFLRRRRKA
jgi:hypothetical protein